ncbi:MAG: hypothetical protein WCP16_25615 [Pseudanabaena sp. ELA645]
MSFALRKSANGKLKSYIYEDRLCEQNFMELVKLTIAQLPLIGNIFKDKN